MKKKLFTLMTLLLCLCSGAWGQSGDLLNINFTDWYNDGGTTQGNAHYINTASSGTYKRSNVAYFTNSAYSTTAPSATNYVCLTCSTSTYNVYAKNNTDNSSGESRDCYPVTQNSNTTADVTLAFTLSSAAKIEILAGASSIGNTSATYSYTAPNAANASNKSYNFLSNDYNYSTGSYSLANDNKLNTKNTVVYITETTTSAGTASFSFNAGKLYGATGTNNKKFYIYAIRVTSVSSSYTVTYNNNGGTGTIANSTGTNITLSDGTGFTAPSNYTFAGWNTVNDGSGTSYTAGQTGINKSLNLFAIWTQSTTVDANGGSANTTYTATLNATSIAIASAPTYANHTLTGYFDAATGGNKIANADGTLVANTSCTDANSKWNNSSAAPMLYAQWLDENNATFSNGNYIIGGSALDLSTLFSSSSDGNVTYSVKDANGTGATIASSSFTATTAGSATVTATQAATATIAGATLDATITVAANPLGTHTITYALDVTNKGTTLQTIEGTGSTSTYITASTSTTLLAGGLGTGGSHDADKNKHNGTRTLGINTLSTETSDKYFYVTFNVADGYFFNPTSISLKALTIGGNNTSYKAVLTDGTNSIVGTANATNDSEITLGNWIGLSSTSLQGDVTLKLYAWHTTSGDYNAYRLSTPITITGTVGEVGATTPYTAPTITDKNGTVKITSPDEGVVVSQIKYSLDNGTTWNTYSIPFNLSEAKTVKAKVVVGSNPSKSESPVASAECSAIPAAVAGSQSITLFADESNFTKSASISGSNKNDTWTGNTGTYLDSYVIVLDNVGKSGNDIKDLSTGSNINSKKTFKGSNGRTLNFTLPTGVKVNRITVYSYTNGDDDNHYASGWKFNGTAADIIGLSLRDLPENAGRSVSSASNPDVRVFSFATPLENTFTFTNSGYQQCFYMVLDYTFPGPTDPVEGESSISLTTTEQMAGWRSFFDASQDYTADENTTVYVVKAKSGVENQVVLSEYGSNQVPKNHAFILKTSANNRTMTLTKTSGLEFSGDNLLKASTAGQNLASVYRLGANATEVGFFEYTTTSAAAGIVYLDATDVNKSTGARALTIAIEGNTTTGINGIEEVAPVTKTRKVVKNGRLVIETANGEFTIDGARVK